MWVVNEPSAEEISRFYNTNESFLWNSGAFRILQDYQDAPECVRRYYHRERTRFLYKYFPGIMANTGARILDVGCSSGVFLATLRDRGYQVAGQDVAPEAIARGREILGIDLVDAPLGDSRFSGAFDAVTCYDVIEHVPDPRSLVKTIAGLALREAGVVFRTPNHAGWLLRLTGARWLWYIPPAHLHYFNAKSLSNLLSQEGFRVEAVRTGASTYLFFLWHYLAFWKRPDAVPSVNMPRWKEALVYGLDGALRVAAALPLAVGGAYRLNPVLEVYARKE